MFERTSDVRRGRLIPEKKWSAIPFVGIIVIVVMIYSLFKIIVQQGRLTCGL